MAGAKPLGEAPQDLEALTTQLQSLTLPHFTSEDAFRLGISLRSRIRKLRQTAAVINITSTNSDTLLFHCTTGNGITPDNDIWVSRKRKTVKRFGVSSWYMGCKFERDEARFAAKYMLGEAAGSYAIHGGAVPVRVQGVDAVVAVVVVSGLRQEEDHMVVVEGLEELKRRMMDVDSGEQGAVKSVEDGEPTPSTRETKVMVDEAKAGAVLAS